MTATPPAARLRAVFAVALIFLYGFGPAPAALADLDAGSQSDVEEASDAEDDPAIGDGEEISPPEGDESVETDDDPAASDEEFEGDEGADEGGADEDELEEEEAAYDGPVVAVTVKFRADVDAAERQDALDGVRGRSVSQIAPLRLHVVEVPEDEVGEAVASLRGDPRVESVEADRARELTSTPSDPAYPRQWALPKIGWDDVYTGPVPSGSATIAVLDTGVSVYDSDLAGRIGQSFAAVEGSDPLHDPNGHGTSMASIAAAKTDNAAGIAGVAYSNVRIMPVTVLDADGIGWDSDIIEGVVWAADSGADVILMAFSARGYSQHLQDAIDYAWSQGSVVVAATGNDGSSANSFPAGMAGVVGVSATDQNDALWAGSNHGASAFISAPGVDIETGAGSITGTSASAAVVAGSAALMRSFDGSASNGVIVGRLARNTDEAGAQTQTGNGRVNLARSVADTSTDPVKPAGVSASGGPFVGPYVAAGGGSMQGTVTSSTGGAIAGASVSCVSGCTVATSSNVATTAANGTYSLAVDYANASNNASITLRASASGFAPQERVETGLTNASSQTWTARNFTLTPVTAAATATTLSSSASTSTYGEPVTFTATVTSTPTNPSGVGTVTFKRVTETLCAAVPLTGTSATCDTSSLNFGTHKITAEYSGGTGFADSTSSELTQVVNQKSVTGSFTAGNKVYDGTTSASVSGRSLTGGVGSDDVSLSGGTATFDDRNVGTDKTVTLSGATLAGTAAGNYTLAGVDTATANITSRALTISAVSDSKVYDGATSSTGTPSVSGLQAGDTVTGRVQAFASKDVLGANGSTLAVTGYTINDGNSGNNYSVSLETSSGTITPLGIAGTFTAENKVYDGTTSATVTGRSLVGVLGSDTVSHEGGTASFADKNVGTGKTVNLSGASLSGAQAGNYSLSSVSAASADITARSLLVTATGVNKVYDGTTAATVTLDDDRVVGDSLSVTHTAATFGDSGVGTGKTVSVTGISKSGVDAGNYTHNETAATTADISKAPLSVTTVAVSKVYGEANPGFTASYSGFVNGETASFLDGTLSFTTAATQTSDVGTYPVTPGGLTSANYEISFVAANLTVTKAPLTVTAQDASMLVGGDLPAFSVSYSGFVFDQTASELGGTLGFTTDPSPVTGTGSYAIIASGLTSANYAISYVNGTLTVSDKLVPTIEWATPDAIVYGTALSGTQMNAAAVYGGETVPGTFAYTPAGGTVLGAGEHTLSVTFTPTNGATYETVSKTVSLTVNRASLVVTANPSTKVYGESNPAFTASYSGFVNDDTTAALGGTLSFSTAATTTSPVGGYPVTPSGLTSANYSITFVAGTLTVTAKSVTANFTASDKSYDGDTSATVATTTVNGKVGSDDVVLSGGTATFDTKDAGTNKTVTLTGAALGGTAAGNYTLTSVGTATAAITALGITGGFTAGDKVYDGTTSATVTGRSLTGVLGSDTVSLEGGIATFADKTVGSGKTVTLSGATLSGAQSGNYSLSSVSDATAAITALGVTGSFTAQNKVYDGGITATVVGTSVPGKVGADDVTLEGGTASFADENVGTGKTVSLTGASLSGGDAGNYTLSSVSTATADITKAALTVTAEDKSSVYGAANAALTVTFAGFVGGESLGSSGVSGEPACSTTRTAASGVTGSPYAITCEPGTLAAPNYSFSFVAGGYTVSKAPLVVTADDASMPVGGARPTFGVRSIDGFVLGQDVTALGGTVSCAVAEPDPLGVGSYDIECSGYTSSNYDISYIDGTLTVSDKLVPTIAWAAPDAIVYGTGLSGTQLNASASHGGGAVPGTLAYTPAGGTVLGVGSHTLSVTFTPTDTVTYETVSSNVALTVTAKPVTGTFTAADKVYDGTTSATVTGVSVPEKVGADEVTLSGGTATFDTRHVGTARTVTLSGATLTGPQSGNYTLTSVATTTAAITKAGLVIAAVTDSKTYDGGTASSGSPTIKSGLKDGDSVTGRTQTFASKDVLGADGSTLQVTGHTVVDGNDGGNYDVTTQTATGTITPRALSATANDASKVYGHALPAFTVSYDGWAPGEGAGNLGGTITASTTGTSVAAPGTYPITVEGTGTSANYDITYVAGTLTVTKASTTVTLTSDPNPHIQVGQTATFTVTVAAVAPGAGTPSGPVQLSVGGTDIGAPLVLSDGTATMTKSDFTVGHWSVVATYTGDTNFDGSASSPLTVQVSTATTTPAPVVRDPDLTPTPEPTSEPVPTPQPTDPAPAPTTPPVDPSPAPTTPTEPETPAPGPGTPAPGTPTNPTPGTPGGSTPPTAGSGDTTPPSPSTSNGSTDGTDTDGGASTDETEVLGEVVVNEGEPENDGGEPSERRSATPDPTALGDLANDDQSRLPTAVTVGIAVTGAAAAAALIGFSVFGAGAAGAAGAAGVAATGAGAAGAGAAGAGAGAGGSSTTAGSPVRRIIRRLLFWR